jgi:putative membrane protein
MQILDKKMQGYIEQAIHDLERHSHGEVVCVIVNASANYRFLAIIWALLISFIFVPLLNIPGLIINFISLDRFILDLIVETLSFILLGFLFILTPIHIWVTPKRIKKLCAKRHALEQFFINNLHHTKKRLGVLIFVSVAEHYAEIIGDKGINDVMEPGAWDTIIQNLIKSIKQKKLGEGLLYSITQLKSIMVKHFPLQREKPNELPNSVILIDRSDYIS